jgi:hypothetical protein
MTHFSPHLSLHQHLSPSFILQPTAAPVSAPVEAPQAVPAGSNFEVM